jgi:uncharacterized membrane protein
MIILFSSIAMVILPLVFQLCDLPLRFENKTIICLSLLTPLVKIRISDLKIKNKGKITIAR